MAVPRQIDCRKALDRLYEYLDGELGEVRAEEVRAHLDMCAPCLRISRFETAFLRFLEARSRTRGAPEHVKKRVLEHLLFSEDEPERT